jgi:Cu(I)/Ag(I) efflux system membrane protein CusA/SilA
MTIRTLALCFAATGAMAMHMLSGAAAPPATSDSAVTAGAARSGMPVPPAPVTAPAWTVRATVVRVDRAGGVIILRHPPLAALGLRAGTSRFRVAERAFLEQVRAGASIRFSAARIDGRLVLTHLGLEPRRVQPTPTQKKRPE